MTATFSIPEVARTSWQYAKSQIWILAGLLISFLIISWVLSFLLMPASATITGQIFAILVAILLQSLFDLGYYKNYFQTLDGMEPQFSAYGQQARKVITYLVAGLIMAVAIFIGILFLIVPGVYLALRLQFYAAFIIEEDAGIVESLKRSWAITEGHVWKLFLLALVQAGIIILGVIALVIGMFVAIPVVYMMYCYTFRKLNRPVAPEESGSSLALD
jgi:uncharacterized membrane protein